MIVYDKAQIQEWLRMGSRRTFGDVLNKIAKDHDDLIVMAADLANSANLMDFAKNYPDKFYDVGIAESNMIGMASGLAKEGFNVFVVSFAPFVSMRAFEAIRTLAGYMHLNVKVVALASGLSMESHGCTHFGLEDIALLRTIPNMLVMSPTDCTDTAKCVEFLANYKGPAYLRLTGVPGYGSIYKEDYSFDPYGYDCLRVGEDAIILSCGSIVSECIRAARGLENSGVSASVVSVRTLKPINEDAIASIIEKYNYVITVEEHNIIGGLGSAISKIIAERNMNKKHLIIGVEDKFPIAGEYQYLLEQCGISAKTIVNRILEWKKEI